MVSQFKLGFVFRYINMSWEIFEYFNYKEILE